MNTVQILGTINKEPFLIHLIADINVCKRMVLVKHLNPAPIVRREQATGKTVAKKPA
jgi:hypothetical protein